MSTIDEVLLLIARLAAGAFAGSCLYIAVAQQPARMSMPTREALDEFRATIPRAERVQPLLLITGLVAAVGTLFLRFDGAVIAAVLLLGAVLVETVVGVLPINRRLTSGATSDHLPDARSALRRWGTLHAIRTVLAVAAAVLLLI